MAMRKYLSIALLLGWISACSTGPILPPDNNFQAQLVIQTGGGDACSAVRPGLSATGGNDEVITIRFGESFKIVELRPEGDEISPDPVRWTETSENGSETYVLLTEPAQLLVGDLKDHVDQSVCVDFRPGIFTDEDFDGLHDFAALSGVECCGELEEIDE